MNSFGVILTLIVMINCNDHIVIHDEIIRVPNLDFFSRFFFQFIFSLKFSETVGNHVIKIGTKKNSFVLKLKPTYFIDLL